MQDNRLKSKNTAIKAAILFLLFILYTVAVMYVDLQPVGPVNPSTGEPSSVGFGTINAAVHSLFGENLFAHEVTEYIGYGVIGIALVFALAGIIQIIGRRSLTAVDSNIIVLGCLFLLVICFYFFFEVACINLRPVLEEGELEASYPSSHTLISLCVLIPLPGQFRHYFREKKLFCALVEAVSILACLVMVFFRLASGCHWLTDIVGSLILSLALIMFYKSLIFRFCRDF